MFAVAAVSGNALGFEENFGKWLACMDPAGDVCPLIIQRRFEWGAIGVAGIGGQVKVVDAGERGTLVVQGIVLDAEVPQFISPSVDILELGRHLLKRTGQFILVAASQRGLVCGTDNLGMKPMFSASTVEGCFVSNHSSLCGMLADRTVPDFSFTRDIVIRDAVVPSTSLVAGVARLTRGSAFELRDGRLREVQLVNHILTQSGIERDVAVESLRRAARRVGGIGRGLLLGLTGGKDSRLAMAALLAEDVDFQAGTHAMPSRDGEVAEFVARSVGVTFHGIPRTGTAVYPALSRYLSVLPWSDGTLPLGSLDQWYGVYDLAARNGMVHLGGLGGEVARAYWDQEEAAFAAVQQVIESRFFGYHARLFFPNADAWEESRVGWLSLLDREAGIDPFVSVQLAYLDTRLRGMIGLRTNCAISDYAWTIATPELYAYALALPRTQRQKGTIFEDLIGELYPSLLSIDWAAGNAGIVHSRGIRGALHKVKSAAKTVPALQRWRGRFQSARGVRTASFSKCVREAFFADAEIDDWLMTWTSRDAIEMMGSGSSTFVAQAEKCVTMRLAHLVLEAVRDGAEVPVRLWRQPWLSKAIEKMPNARMVPGRQSDG